MPVRQVMVNSKSPITLGNSAAMSNVSNLKAFMCRDIVQM